MSNVATVLVDGDQSLAKSVEGLLRELRFRTAFSTDVSDTDFGNLDPSWDFLVCHLDEDAADPTLPQTISSARANRDEGIPALPVVTIGGRFSQVSTHTLTDSLESDVAAKNVQALAKSLARLATLETELLLRRKTAKDFGWSVMTPPLPQNDVSHASILVSAAGLDAPLVRATLDTFQNITVVDQCQEAFDLVRDQFYDAVLFMVPAGASGQEELTLAWECRQNPRLYNLPIVIVARDDAYADSQKAYEDGASEFIRHAQIEERLKSRMIQMVRRFLYRGDLLKTCQSYMTTESVDRLTGMFNEAYLDTHTANHLILAQTQSRHLAFAAFRFNLDNEIAAQEQYDGPLNLRDLYTQRISALMSRLVRGEDSLCRFDRDKMVLIMPDTDNESAKLVVSRICAIVNNTELGSVSQAGTTPQFLQADITQIDLSDSRDAIWQRLNLV